MLLSVDIWLQVGYIILYNIIQLLTYVEVDMECY